MSSFVLRLMIPVLIAAGYIVLLQRLRSVMPDENTKQPARLWLGVLLLVASSAWYAVMATADYEIWFVPRVYIILPILLMILSSAAVVLIALGVADMFRQLRERHEVFRNQHRGSTILSSLSRTARQPFSMIELMTLTLEEMRIGAPGLCGAIYLYNRSRRELVLTVSHGLKKDEGAYLERLTSETNPLFQAMTTEESVIGGHLLFLGQGGDETVSRFRSTLSIPLISGAERLGGILLLSEKDRYFDKGLASALESVSSWLSERIRATRLTRELKQSTASILGKDQQLETTIDRLTAVLAALSSEHATDAFCRAMRGVGGAEHVYLIGLASGNVTVDGGTDKAEEFSEQYQAAIVNAFDRNKPLIINQEGSTADGQSRTVMSSLVYPIRTLFRREALLLRKSDDAFAVSESDLRLLHFASLAAGVVLQKEDYDRLSITRRRGFEKVLGLLKIESPSAAYFTLEHFDRQLGDILPRTASRVTLVRSGEFFRQGKEGTPAAASIHASQLVGIFAESVAHGDYKSAVGASAVSTMMLGIGPQLRDCFGSMHGHKGTPSMVAVCPYTEKGHVAAIACVALYDISDSECAEWDRVLALAVMLYRLSQSVAEVKTAPHIPTHSMGMLNDMNNDLTAVIGNAELLLSNIDLSRNHRGSLEKIILSAQEAARRIRQSELGGSTNTEAPTAPEKMVSFNAALQEVLRNARISEGLYMLRGRPREVDLFLNPEAALHMVDASARKLVEEILGKIVSAAADDDVVAVSSYRRDTHVYFDFVRRKRHTVNVEAIADVGQYSLASEVLRYRPEDSYLAEAVQANGSVAFDRMTQQPTYLSLRFPAATGDKPTQMRHPRLLAIDDQPIILELITSMCQSMGYEVETARSGEEGIRMATSRHFDVVMTDFSMAGISGIEVAKTLHLSRPNLPVILITGWDTGLSHAELASSGICEIVHKPFKIEQLTTILRSVTSKSSA